MFYIETNIGIVEFHKPISHMRYYWPTVPIERLLIHERGILISLQKARKILKNRKALIRGSTHDFSYIHTMKIKYYDGN